MASEPDVNDMHAEIDQTRADLTEKLETLESQVMGTVSSARENVQDTIDQVTSAVQGTVDQVTHTVQDTVDQVKQTFDLSYQIQARPWVLVGGSVVAGLLVGALVGRESRGVRRGAAFTAPRAPYPPAEGRAAPEMEAPSYVAPRREPAGPSIFGSLWQQFQPELEKVKEMAIGYAAGAVRDMVKQSLPAFGQQIDEMMNNVTTKLGGTPVREPVLSPSGESHGRHDGGAAEGRFSR
jgi:ElaB/YqjD/DUF883 family membrane-anchored ribosome-binding protein